MKQTRYSDRTVFTSSFEPPESQAQTVIAASIEESCPRAEVHGQNMGPYVWRGIFGLAQLAASV